MCFQVTTTFKTYVNIFFKEEQYILPYKQLSYYICNLVPSKIYFLELKYYFLKYVHVELKTDIIECTNEIIKKVLVKTLKYNLYKSCIIIV